MLPPALCGLALFETQNTAAAGLFLPLNGKLSLGDGIKLQLSEYKESSDTQTEWGCKPASATRFDCGDNWNLLGFDEPTPAHAVPCSTDTVVFPDDQSAVQVMR